MREPHGLVLVAPNWWEISSIGLLGREEKKARFWEKRKDKGERLEVPKGERVFKLSLEGEERRERWGHGEEERGCKPVTQRNLERQKEKLRERVCVCVWW